MTTWTTRIRQQFSLTLLKENLRPVAAVTLSALIVLGTWNGLSDLDVYARLAFMMFGLAIVGWTLTSINNTYIAVAAALSFTLVGVDEPTRFFESLADPIIWLLIAAFVVSAGVSASGLSTRITIALATRARTVQHLFYLLTVVLIITAFIIPSTSGRAALMVPIFVGLSQNIAHRPTVRALSLLFPTVILLSAIASLIGAGAHLVTVDLLWHMGYERISFGRWIVLGLPFAIVSSFVSVWILLRMFLSKGERHQPLQISANQLDDGYSPQWSRTEKYVGLLITGLVVLWSTEAWHGFNNTIIAIIGALLITAPNYGVVDFKKAVNSVNWNLILFMAATLKLGEALIESGGAQWLVESIFMTMQESLAQSSFWTISLIALIALLSHLLITSRTARASVVVPLVILVAASLGYSPVPIAFLTTVGVGFCLTLPVSAKPVAMFANADERAYQPRDLLRYSSILLPVHLVLLVAFAFGVWPAFGMSLSQTEIPPSTVPSAPGWIDLPDYNPVSPNPLSIFLGVSTQKGPIDESAVPGDPHGNQPILIPLTPAPTPTTEPQSTAVPPNQEEAGSETPNEPEELIGQPEEQEREGSDDDQLEEGPAADDSAKSGDDEAVEPEQDEAGDDQESEQSPPPSPPNSDDELPQPGNRGDSSSDDDDRNDHNDDED
ncbi:MAG: SLC13 family permease [Ardenticatenaceae bacterium]|nr:SLC13 family permease [Ardenticatenaceae bacterium]